MLEMAFQASLACALYWDLAASNQTSSTLLSSGPDWRRCRSFAGLYRDNRSPSSAPFSVNVGSSQLQDLEITIVAIKRTGNGFQDGIDFLLAQLVQRIVSARCQQALERRV
jgi:hypothetical protein